MGDIRVDKELKAPELANAIELKRLPIDNGEIVYYWDKDAKGIWELHYQFTSKGGFSVANNYVKEEQVLVKTEFVSFDEIEKDSLMMSLLKQNSIVTLIGNRLVEKKAIIPTFKEERQAMEFFIQKVKDDIFNNPIVIERYYSDDYFTDEEASKYFDQIQKKGNLDDLNSELIEMNIEYIVNSADLGVKEVIKDNLEILTKNGIDTTHVLEDYTLLNKIASDLGVEFDVGSLPGTYPIDIQAYTWFGEYIALNPFGEVDFSSNSSTEDTVIISSDFISWLNALGYSIKDYVDEVISRKGDSGEGMLLTSNDLTSVEELYLVFTDNNINPIKLCSFDVIASVLNNCGTNGDLLIGGYITGRDIEEFLKDKDATIQAKGIGVINYYYGGGYVSSLDSKDGVLPMMDCFIDSGKYGIKGIYGRKNIW